MSVHNAISGRWFGRHSFVLAMMTTLVIMSFVIPVGSLFLIAAMFYGIGYLAGWTNRKRMVE